MKYERKYTLTAEYFETTRKVDADGQVIEQTSTERFRSDEPQYVKLYIDTWCLVKDIKGVNTHLLFLMLPHMSYADTVDGDGDAANAGQVINLNSYLRQSIGKRLGWAEKSVTRRFSNELKKLCDANVLRKICNNAYQVNPGLIGHGSWKDIRNLRYVTFDLWKRETTNLEIVEEDQSGDGERVWSGSVEELWPDGI